MLSCFQTMKNLVLPGAMPWRRGQRVFGNGATTFLSSPSCIREGNSRWTPARDTSRTGADREATEGRVSETRARRSAFQTSYEADDDVTGLVDVLRRMRDAENGLVRKSPCKRRKNQDAARTRNADRHGPNTYEAAGEWRAN